MTVDSRFEELINEALSQELVGWDFQWWSKHITETALPWDYRQVVTERIRKAHSLLDLGTGGGEFLSSLAPLPPKTCATEGYAPNVPIARERLAPLGVPVADVSQTGDVLPFEAESFDLVIDRHNGCDAAELYRVLRLGGRYVTQQVGGENCMDLNRFLQEEPYYRYADTLLEKEVKRLEAAGLRILDQREDFPVLTFLDIGAVVFYLKAISWQIEDFSVEKYREKLYQIHQTIEQTGGFAVKEHRLLIEAEKP